MPCIAMFRICVDAFLIEPNGFRKIAVLVIFEGFIKQFGRNFGHCISVSAYK